MDITELRKLVENATYLEPSSWGLFPDSLRLYGDKLLLLASLLDEHEAVVEALRMLHDEQNGPPLVQREAEWEEAMKMTRAALALSEGAAVNKRIAAALALSVGDKRPALSTFRHLRALVAKKGQEVT